MKQREIRQVLATLLISTVLALTTSPAYAAAEKGPRCSDGLDNDGDSLIDRADPDCGNQTNAPVPEITDADGDEVGRIASIRVA
jgi:hypothetical protein